MSTKLKLAFASSVLAVGLFSFSPAVACEGKDKTAKAADSKPAAPVGAVTTAVFRVDGMHCGGCGDKIKDALAKTQGVQKVEVKTADKRVVVSFDSAKTNAEKIAKIISEAGYPASAEV
jgi:copper chaperone CopZ